MSGALSSERVNMTYLSALLACGQPVELGIPTLVAPMDFTQETINADSENSLK